MVNRVFAYGLIVVAVGLLPSLFNASAALATSREAVLENGKTCRVMGRKPHFHKGHGRYNADLEVAKAAAVARWASFTVWEYGAAWGNIALAERVSFDCMTGASGAWICGVKAQPCRP